jgi:hypothetical protein
VTLRWLLACLIALAFVATACSSDDSAKQRAKAIAVVMSGTIDSSDWPKVATTADARCFAVAFVDGIGAKTINSHHLSSGDSSTLQRVLRRLVTPAVTGKIASLLRQCNLNHLIGGTLVNALKGSGFDAKMRSTTTNCLIRWFGTPRGSATLVAAGLTQEHLSRADAQKLAHVLVECVDWRRLAAETLSSELHFALSSNEVTCAGRALSSNTALYAGALATIEHRPAPNGTVMGQKLGPSMLKCLSGFHAIEAGFQHPPLSPSERSCLEQRIKAAPAVGEDFKAAIIAGGPSDPANAQQLRTIFQACLTPERLAKLQRG